MSITWGFMQIGQKLCVSNGSEAYGLRDQEIFCKDGLQVFIQCRPCLCSLHSEKLPGWKTWCDFSVCCPVYSNHFGVWRDKTNEFRSFWGISYVESDHQHDLILDAKRYYDSIHLSLSSIHQILSSLDSTFALEAEIGTTFGVPSITEELQNTAVNSLLSNSVIPKIASESSWKGSCLAICRAFSPTIWRRFIACLCMWNALTEALKTFRSTYSEKLWNTGENSLIDILRPFRTHRERNKRFGSISKPLRIPCIVFTRFVLLPRFHFKTIQKRLDAFPAFFQALYSAIASISDLSFAVDYSVPAGIAEYLDHAIRVEK